MNVYIHTNKATKKAWESRLILVEVASLQVKIFDFVLNFLRTPQILRGKTKALKKLLLHTPINRIVQLECNVNIVVINFA